MIDRLGLFTQLAWRNLWRNARRTAITFAAISVGVWSMIVLAALMQAWGASAFDAAVRNLTGHGQIHAPQYLDDPTVDHRFDAGAGPLRAVLNGAAVRAWAARVRVPAIVQTARENAPVTLVGIDAEAERGLSFIPDAVVEGRYLTADTGSDGAASDSPASGGPGSDSPGSDSPGSDSAGSGSLGSASNGILLGRKLAERLRTGVGKRVVILSQAASGEIAERGFRVIGIFAAEQQRTETEFAFVTRPSAQAMLGIGDAVSEIAFVLGDVDRLPDVISELRQAAPGLDVMSWSELEPFTQAILDISDGTIALWTVIMFVLVALGLVNTLLMAVLERTREFGLLQALGLRPRLLLLQVLLESVFLVGLGVAFGVVAGIATLLAFHGGLDLSALAQGGAEFGIGRILYPYLDITLTLEIAAFVWLMGIVTSLYPAWRASRDVPVAAINKAY
jgi:ABC-type lipoprotein release transport system permease subunit